MGSAGIHRDARAPSRSVSSAASSADQDDGQDERNPFLGADNVVQVDAAEYDARHASVSAVSLSSSSILRQRMVKRRSDYLVGILLLLLVVLLWTGEGHAGRTRASDRRLMQHPSFHLQDPTSSQTQSCEPSCTMTRTICMLTPSCLFNDAERTGMTNLGRSPTSTPPLSSYTSSLSYSSRGAQRRETSCRGERLGMVRTKPKRNGGRS